jgi:hypothetical protein
MSGILLKAEFRGGGFGLVYREPGHDDFAVIPHSSSQGSHLHIGKAATIVRIIGQAEAEQTVSEAIRASMLAHEALEALIPQMESSLGGPQMCPGVASASSRLGRPLASLLAQSQGD